MWVLLQLLVLALGGLYSTAPVASAVGYYAKLAQIRTSDGTWDRLFDPEVAAYEIRLSAGTPVVTVEAMVDFAHYSGPDEFPLLTIDGDKVTYGSDNLITDTILINDTSPGAWQHDVTVIVEEPPETESKKEAGARGGRPPVKTTYHLRLHRAPDVEQLLRPTALSLEDDHGNPVQLRPPFFALEDAQGYQAALSPKVRQVKFTFECDALATAEVNGVEVENGNATWVPLKERQTSTVVHAACVYGSDRRTHDISLFEVADLDAVAAQLELLVLGSHGHVRRTGNNSFVVTATVPDLELVPIYRDSRVMLRLMAPGEEAVTLGPGIPTPLLAVPRNGSRTVHLLLRSHADAKNVSVELLRYRKPVMPERKQPRRLADMPTLSGCALVAAVMGCLALNALASGVTVALGLGGPLDSSAALRSLALLLQAVALTNTADGHESFTEFTQVGDWNKGSGKFSLFIAWTASGEAMRWLCLIPGRSPWEVAEGDAQLQAGAREAALCLGASLGLLAAVATVHLALLLLRLPGGCCRVVPHQLRFGTWEVRCLLYVTYPASCAAALLLLLPSPTMRPGGDVAGEAGPWSVALTESLQWRMAVGAALLAPALVGLVAACRVRQALRQRLVTWVAEEAGSGNARGCFSRKGSGRMGPCEGGYFCDATCDQISTLPEERSCCPGLLSLRWAGTVAQVCPVDLTTLLPHGTTCLQAEALHSLLEDYEEGSPDWGLEAAGNHQMPPDHESGRAAVVEVLATVPACALGCSGRTALTNVGFSVGVPWLEALIGPRDLIKMHQQALEPDSRLPDAVIPVHVQITQLQGPLTSGALSFCFNGLRWPHLPPLELTFRWALGILSAVAVGAPAGRSVALASAGCLAGSIFAVAFLQAPCTAFSENCALLLAYLGLSLTFFAYLGHTSGVLPPEVSSGIVFLTTACATVPVLPVVILRTLVLCCAATCGRRSGRQDSGHQRRCNVDLGLRWPRDAQLLLVPARCHLPVLDWFVYVHQTSPTSAEVQVEKTSADRARPRLEFPILDYLATSHRLEPPLVALFGPSQTKAGYSPLGYRAEVIYNDEDATPIVATFVERCVGLDFTQGVVWQVLRLISQHAAKGHIVAVELEAPLPEGHTVSTAGLESCLARHSSSGSSGDDSEEVPLVLAESSS